MAGTKSPFPAGQDPSAAKTNARTLWTNVVLAAVLMLATMPGRTYGLGQITEPLLRELRLDRVEFASYNLWATLLGAIFCLPMGWLLDRCGVRWTSTTLVLLLSVVVWKMSVHAGGVTSLFLLILFTRTLGQSALSVASITVVSKSTGTRTGIAMGVYSVLFTVLMAAAFPVVAGIVRDHGWRTAWSTVAIALFVGVAPLAALFLREPAGTVSVKQPADGAPEALSGQTLGQALRTPVFWVFGGAIALFGLAHAGLGLFNEAILAERGFDQRTASNFFAGTIVFGLLGQMLCGWLTLRFALPHLLGAALFLYATGLGGLPLLKSGPLLWVFAAIFGISGGFITVIFFAVWREAFGRTYLGRIQGAAQMLAVLASAVGPLLFALCQDWYSSYAPLLFALAIVVFLFGLAALRTNLVAVQTESAT